MSDSWLLAWTVAHEAPLSMEFSRQEYWKGLPFPPPGDLPDLRNEPLSPASLALAGRFLTAELPEKHSSPVDDALKGFEFHLQCDLWLHAPSTRWHGELLQPSACSLARNTSSQGKRQVKCFGFNTLLLLLLLSHFSRVRLCVTPLLAAHQAHPSLGFSRQEHWSGLPFPSPVHESEKWKGSCSVVSDSLRPPGLQPTRLLRPWDFPGKSTGVGCHCLLRNTLKQP